MKRTIKLAPVVGCGALCALLLACSNSDESSTGGGGSGNGGGSTNTTTTTGTGTTTSTTTTVNPGDDPCSGNSFTATAPSNGQGSEPGNSTADQHQARLDVDTLRNLLGLNPINFNAALNQASQAHSDYCNNNPSLCPGSHQETAGGSGFTGVNFWDRDTAAGYSGSPRFEVMALGVGPDGSIEMWVETVYHRTPFVTPDMGETGFGHAASYDTMDFGNSGPVDSTFVTNYPVHGQTGVLSSWGGNEGPAPPAPPGGFPSGPIISVIFPTASGLSITAHDIYDSSCNALPHQAGGADLPSVGFNADFLGPTVALYANSPLSSGAQYTVNVEYTLGGSPGHRTFQFTTN